MRSKQDSRLLEKGIKENPMKCEYFLPSVVSDLLAEGRATVRVLESEDKWYGVTYKEDKPVVVAAVQALKDRRSLSTEIVGLDYVLSVTEFVNNNDHATFLP